MPQGHGPEIFSWVATHGSFENRPIKAIFDYLCLKNSPKNKNKIKNKYFYLKFGAVFWI